MKKLDEIALWASIGDEESAYNNPRDAGEALGIHPKRVASLCLKWTKKGIYDYGVCCDLGWKVEKKK